MKQQSEKIQNEKQVNPADKARLSDLKQGKEKISTSGDKGNGSDKPTKKNKTRISFKLSAAIVIVINILLIMTIFFMLGTLRDKGVELKKLRNDYMDTERRGEVELSDLHVQSYIDRSNFLMSLFPDEAGLVNFVKEIERLKVEGVVRDFSFANENAVRDKTGVLGIPFILRLEGTWDQLNSDFMQLQKFPYLIRAVTVDVRIKDINTGIIDFMYGGFIYVDKSLEKN